MPESTPPLPAWLDELAALEQQATPGPWDIGISYISEKADIYVDPNENTRLDQSRNCIADSRFLAALRNAFPDMFALIRQQAAEIEGLKRERDDRDRIIEILESCTCDLPFTLTDMMDDDDRAFYQRFNNEDDEESDDD